MGLLVKSCAHFFLPGIERSGRTTNTNTMRRTYLLTILSLLMVTILHAQTASDALRWSYLNGQGTARAMGTGMAVGALGGDFSSLSINPAGIGGYWKSEFMVTPSIFNISTESSLNGGLNTQETDRQFNLSNLGIVFANTPRRGKWKAVGLGFGLNKMNNFNQEFFFTGETPGSIVDRFAGLAYGLTPDELDNFEAGLAYETGAIFDAEKDGIYETDFLDQDQDAFSKRQLVKSSGHMNEMVISFGGNLDNNLLLGATLGIPFLKYESEKQYTESDPDDVIPTFNGLKFDEALITEGSGVNLKVGAIAKLGQQFRLGAAFHSPTYLSLTDRYTTDMAYDFIQSGSSEEFQSNSPEGEFEYAITTPWKAVGSAAAIFGKSGFVSADIEYIDYGAARYDFTTNSDNIADREYQEEVNQSIKDLYGGAINIKLGGELAYQGLRLRGGVQVLGSPFVDDHTSQKIFSIGGGIRGDRAFLDVAYTYHSEDQTYLPYAVEGAPSQIVSNDTRRTQLVFTVGLKI